MVDKKDYMTISDMAKQRNVTTETLRHYDRKGLFHPRYTDPDTGYRYYSIDQYEILGTIKELQQMGMKLDDIKNYFENRTLEKSTTLLRNHCDQLKKEILKKTILVRTIEAKLEFLDEIISLPGKGEVFIKQFPERYIISFYEWVKGKRERMKAIMRLEEIMRGDKIAPIIASNRIGACSNADFMTMNQEFAVAPIVMCDEYIEELEYSKIIPAGEYICMFYTGKFGECLPSFQKIRDWIGDNGYEINGLFYQFYQIDVTVTSNLEETLSEIQIPVKKSDT